MISAPVGNDLLFDDLSPEQENSSITRIWNALKTCEALGIAGFKGSNVEGLTDPDVSGFASSEAEAQPVTNLFAVEWFFENRLVQKRDSKLKNS
jgi:hypothetical protein